MSRLVWLRGVGKESRGMATGRNRGLRGRHAEINIVGREEKERKTWGVKHVALSEEERGEEKWDTGLLRAKEKTVIADIFPTLHLFICHHFFILDSFHSSHHAVCFSMPLSLHLYLSSYLVLCTLNTRKFFHYFPSALSGFYFAAAIFLCLSSFAPCLSYLCLLLFSRTLYSPQALAFSLLNESQSLCRLCFWDMMLQANQWGSWACVNHSRSPHLSSHVHKYTHTHTHL